MESLLSLRLADNGPSMDTCIQHTVQEPYGYYLKVSYLLSNCFTEQTNSLPITVAFSSKESISFKAQVRFFDDLGNNCEVLVYATADNSLLTTHSFLCAEFSRYRTLRNTEKEHVGVARRPTMSSASPLASVYSDYDDDDDIDVGSARMSSKLLQVSYTTLYIASGWYVYKLSYVAYACVCSTQ